MCTAATNIDDLTIEDPLLEEVREASKDDDDICSLIKSIHPDRLDKITKGTDFHGIRHALNVDDGLLLYGTRLIIPKGMRRDILTRLHGSHQGIDHTLKRARQCVYWPGITSDITNTVRSCRKCQERLPSQQAEPLALDTVLSRPFESVSSDLFQYVGKYYLAYSDRYSGWPCINMWSDCPTSKRPQ